MKQFLKLFFIFLIIAVLPACGPLYKKRSLSYLQESPADFKENKNGLSLSVKKLNKRQMSSLFDGQGKYFSKIGTQPLYLKITNDSNKTFLLDSKDISLEPSNPQMIKMALAKGYLPVAGSFSKAMIPVAGSLLFLGFHNFIHDPAITILTFPILVVSCAIVVCCTPFFLGYACYSSYQTNNQINEFNETLVEDISEKTIPDSFKIPADTTHDFLFFADATQFKNTFSVTFTEKVTQQPLTFNVTL